MKDLASQLANLIVQDNAVLFVGAELRQGEGQTSLVRQIAEALAARIEYARPDRSLPAVARDYEVLKGRGELVVALREELDKLASGPGELQELLADAVLPTTKVITTRFDRLLERSLESHSKPYVLIVRDTDVPFFDESKVTLIKIQGDIGQPESLVITEDDLDAFISELPTVSDLIRAYFATKTLIFLGYDLNSPVFKRFYRQVTRHLSSFRRQAHAILAEPLDEVERRYWEGQSIKVDVLDPKIFLTELGSAVKERSKAPDAEEANPLLWVAKPPLPDRPYKALESFSGEDAAIFSGRKEESDRLTNRVLAHRLTVVYGESGSGKTSLLQAGVRPRLAARRALLAVAPVAAGVSLDQLLGSAVAEAASAAGVQLPEAPDLRSQVRQLQETLSGPVVLVLDQFEQLFVSYDESQQLAGSEVLAELSRASDLDIRLVVVLREDFLGRLQTLTNVLPGLLDVRFRLERLGREAARAAIEEPAQLFGVQWQPALVERLLDELYEGAGGGVAPAQLQLVCDRLYEVKKGTAASPDSQGITISETDFEELGGTQGILGEYVDQAIASLAPDDRPRARTLLGTLVSSSGTKQRLQLDDLARAADIQVPEAAEILEELTRRRIVRRYELQDMGEAAVVQFELTHDYLALRIARWLGEDFWAAQKAREIVRESLPEWQRGRRLPAPGDVRVAASHHGQIRFAEEELEMLFAAAVAYGQDSRVWEALLPEPSREDLLTELVQHDDPHARLGAAGELTHYDGPEVANALVKAVLTDPDSEVREAATLSIARMGAGADPGVSIASLSLLVIAAGEEGSREAAVRALATMRDLRPSIDKHLPDVLRGAIRKQTRAIRLKRERDRIFRNVRRGALGGYVGVGFSLAMFTSSGGDIAQADPAYWVVFFLAAFIILGIFGALIGALVSSGRGLLASIQDRTRRWMNWAVVGAVASFVPALLFVSTPLPGDNGEGSAFYLVAFLFQFSLLAYGASLPVKRRGPRFAIAGLAGALSSLLLASQFGGILLLSGIVSGIVMSFGFRDTIDHEAALRERRASANGKGIVVK